ncbi:MAG TPA: hypothetical protein ENJ16_04740 [Planctomycetaceae bacterium]|nr:hypothetical protein [Planctomycetaceae bacterium]
MGRLSVEKGKRGEREAAAAIRRLFATEARRGRQYHGREEAPDILTGIAGVHFEVKRTEALHLYHAIEQAAADAGKNVPVVLHRRNKRPWVAIVRLDDLPDLAVQLYLTLAGLVPLKTPRTCLKCDRWFGSDGPANRICPPCSRENDERYGEMDERWLAAQRGRKYRNGEPLP